MQFQRKFLIWLLILCFLFLVILQGISKLPGMPEPLYHRDISDFMIDLYTEYPVEHISVSYIKGETIRIDISTLCISQENVLSLVLAIRNLVTQDKLLGTLLNISKDRIDEHSWNLGCRPCIEVRITGFNGLWGNDNYVFVSQYYLERFNSGLDPASYTLDGFSTWEGVDTITNEHFSMGDILSGSN